MDNVTSKYVIDFKDVTSVYDMFEIISTEMDFPDYFGNNWDAFGDCMTDIICTNIEIYGTYPKRYFRYLKSRII